MIRRRTFVAGTGAVLIAAPLAASMGHHDPLDGLITCIQLETTAALMWPRRRGRTSSAR